MQIKLDLAGRRWHLKSDQPVELAIPLDFYGDQPRAFGLAPAHAEAVEAGDFVGDTRRGGSANCEVVELTPHGNGTHTECVGHLTEERISVADAVPQPLLAATLLTVTPRLLEETEETYQGICDGEDQILCLADLRASFAEAKVDSEFLQALILRVQQGPEHLADHSGTNPPYPTTEAIGWLRQQGCDHLLVELPSIDRESDGGTLPNHHLFFGVQPGQRADDASRSRTVTEMIAVPPDLPDGPYALSLRFPRFKLDAAPSRPVIYGVATRG